MPKSITMNQNMVSCFFVILLETNYPRAHSTLVVSPFAAWLRANHQQQLLKASCTASQEKTIVCWRPKTLCSSTLIMQLHDAVLLQAPRPQSPIRPNGGKSYKVRSFSGSRVPNWKPNSNATTAAPTSLAKSSTCFPTARVQQCHFNCIVDVVDVGG